MHLDDTLETKLDNLLAKKVKPTVFQTKMSSKKDAKKKENSSKFEQCPKKALLAGNFKLSRKVGILSLLRENPQIMNLLLSNSQNRKYQGSLMMIIAMLENLVGKVLVQNEVSANLILIVTVFVFCP